MKAKLTLAIFSFLTIAFTQARADAEFFLRISDDGRYTVSIDDQTITMSRGRFRFFDLPAGRQRIAILRNNMQVFEDWIDLRNDSRTVAEFVPRRGIRPLSVYPLYINGRYCGPDWDQQGYTNNGPNWPNGNPDRPNGNTWPDRDRPGNGNGNYPPNTNTAGMSRFDFEQLKSRVNRESFDERKFELLRNVLPGRPLSSAQLSDLLRQFSFDKYRLETAKVGWESVTDRQNYYIVFDTFSFDSSKRDLKQFINWR